MQPASTGPIEERHVVGLKGQGEGTLTLTRALRGGSGLSQAPRKAAAGGDLAAADALQAILKSLADSKSEDLVSIDIASKSSLGDYMVVASGRSHRHVSAIAERLLQDLKVVGGGDVRVEGMPHCDWVLIDQGDVIVHIFRPEVRRFYNIEKMWSADHPAAPVVV